MFPRLIESERFSQDLQLWKSKINSLDNLKARDKGHKLLEQYINEARQIDAGHDITYARNIKPEKLRETVASLQTARYRVEKFVKDIDN